MITMGATGRLITGDVLDVNAKSLEKVLRDYDSHLYLKWNSSKRRGYGCWEVRRHPEKKSVVDVTVFEGNSYCTVDFYELDIVNHVIDVDYLNYNVLSKIKKMDLWSQMTNVGEKQVSYWIDRLEAEEKQVRDAERENLHKERTYALKQHKAAINDFKAMILSGVNPDLLAKYWGQSGL